VLAGIFGVVNGLGRPIEDKKGGHAHVYNVKTTYGTFVNQYFFQFMNNTICKRMDLNLKRIIRRLHVTIPLKSVRFIFIKDTLIRGV